VSLSSTPVKLGVFAIGLAVAFGGAFAVGGATEPIVPGGDSAAGASASADREDADMSIHGDARDEHADDAAAPRLPGLAVSERRFTLVPSAATLPAGPEVPFSFTVTGPDGAAVQEYNESHEKELQLIVVRRDLAGFQHVHPVRAAAGTWSVDLDLAQAGTYRVFADFAPAGLAGDGVTLGTELSVAGAFAPVALPAPAPVSTVDGYEVRLDGDPVAGPESELTFTVARDGRPVTDLEPYLGAFGHLVSLRAGDLAYLHTHPAQSAHAGEVGGPRVRFATTFPTAGTYRLFLDFAHAGEVHTAAFTVVVGGQEAP